MAGVVVAEAGVEFAARGDAHAVAAVAEIVLCGEMKPTRVELAGNAPVARRSAGAFGRRQQHEARPQPGHRFLAADVGRLARVADVAERHFLDEGNIDPALDGKLDQVDRNSSSLLPRIITVFSLRRWKPAACAASRPRSTLARSPTRVIALKRSARRVSRLMLMRLTPAASKAGAKRSSCEPLVVITSSFNPGRRRVVRAARRRSAEPAARRR
jgi:hypothetical protein